MNQAPHITTTLRQTHRTATTLLPVLTATLTVAGAVIAAMEARAPHAPESDVPAESASAAPTDTGVIPTRSARRASYGAGRVTVRAFIATLVGRALLVALGIALVCSLVYAASVTGRTGQAILMTTLILLALYLTEKVARRA